MENGKCTYLGNDGIWAEYELSDPSGNLAKIIYEEQDGEMESNSNLIINGKDLGRCTAYRQNREEKSWVFLMEDSYFVTVEWNTIRSFSSYNGLVIETYK